MAEADDAATVTLTLRLPGFMVSRLDAIVSASRPAAPTFRAPSRTDLIRRAIGEHLATHEVPPAPPAPPARPRVSTTTYPPRAQRRAAAR